MFREIILPMFRSIRQCYSFWYNVSTMLPATDNLFLYRMSCIS